MEEIIIWHNPKCSKSREAKNILDNANVLHGTFDYLNDKIDKKTIPMFAWEYTHF